MEASLIVSLRVVEMPIFARRPAKSMSKFFYNRETTILVEAFYCDRVQNSHNAQKVNKGPYWLVKNTTHFIRWFEREHLIQLTDSRE